MPYITTRTVKSSSSGKTDSQEGSTEFQEDSPEQDPQEDPVLVTQVQFGLDIQDRKPENSLTPDQPAYLQLIEEAVEAGVNVLPPPPLALPQIQLAPQLPAPVLILPMAHQQAQAQQQVAAAPAALSMQDKLQGTIPTIFNGNHRKSENFLHQFNLFWGMNETHPVNSTGRIDVSFHSNAVQAGSNSHSNCCKYLDIVFTAK